ncbi:MAG: glycosyltransferase [Eubacteriales bacterium]
MNDLVSVVVPVYNGEQYIRETIQSVQQQTYVNWELIIVDDGSTDATRAILQEYTVSPIKVILQPSNLGVAKARNRGVEEARGRFIAFLDGDDLWEEQKLERQVAFAHEKNAAFLCTSYEYADEKGMGLGKIAHVPNTITYEEALKNTIIFTSTVLLDLAKITKEEIKMPTIESEDTATWWKILRSGYRAYGLDEVFVRYRRPSSSLSSNKIKAIQRIWYLYRKQENLSILKSGYCFVHYAIKTTLRRL